MKRLYKSSKNKVIAGVCGGIAEYFAVDPVLIRLLAVLFFFAGGAALIAYILGMIIIPHEPLEWSKEEAAVQGQSASVPNPASASGTNQVGALIIGVIMILLGAHFLMRNIPFLNHFYWQFWDMGWHFFWPSVLIALGLLIILRNARK